MSQITLLVFQRKMALCLGERVVASSVLYAHSQLQQLASSLAGDKPISVANVQSYNWDIELSRLLRANQVDLDNEPFLLKRLDRGVFSVGLYRCSVWQRQTDLGCYQASLFDSHSQLRHRYEVCCDVKMGRIQSITRVEELSA